MATAFGNDQADILRAVVVLARSATALKAQGADVRAWFDRLSTGTDQQAADALVAHVTGAGGVLSNPDALLVIRAMREITFWTGNFAPTYTLDVRGPSALV